MRRLAFIAALFGMGSTAKAQGEPSEKGTERPRREWPGGDPAENIGYWARLGRKRLKPRNGECPVCGTMAEPFMASHFDIVVTHRRIDCAHCGVTFRQEMGR